MTDPSTYQTAQGEMKDDSSAAGAAPQSELLPCPFCRSTEIDIEELGYNALGHAMCRGCGATGPIAEKTRGNARAAWNRRPAAMARNEVLEEAALAILKDAPANDRGGHYEEAAEIVRSLKSEGSPKE